MMMLILVRLILIVLILAANPVTMDAENSNSDWKIFPLTLLEGLELMNVKAELVMYEGRKGIRIVKDIKENAGERPQLLAIIADIDFRDGTITLELAGQPAPDAQEGSRGFVGIAFRVQNKDSLDYECFYLRPTNGRAMDQLQHNHSTQYISHPDYPWHKLRKENPGVYESYVDLVPGQWTAIKIAVSGQQARLYVHDVEQPCLVVNDLKHGNSRGKVALWTARSTVAHFRNLVVQSTME